MLEYLFTSKEQFEDEFLWDAIPLELGCLISLIPTELLSVFPTSSTSACRMPYHILTWTSP